MRRGKPVRNHDLPGPTHGSATELDLTDEPGSSRPARCRDHDLHRSRQQREGLGSFAFRERGAWIGIGALEGS